MAIPVGKLALYTAARRASTRPGRCRSRSTSARTTRELLDDPLYLGYRAPRLRGRGIRRGPRGVRRVRAARLPAAVLQWEDFKQHNALRILERYRHRLPSFNDDIQGTGAVVVAGLLAARRAEGGLGGDRFLFVGAGAAAIGIAGTLRAELVQKATSRAAPRTAPCSP